MDYIKILLSFLQQIVTSAIGIYIAYLIIQRRKKHHDNRSKKKSE